MNKTIIINGRIVLPEGVLADGCVEFADGKITAVKEGPYNGQATGTIINAQGNYVSPGFIDIHTHGARRSRFYGRYGRSVPGGCADACQARDDGAAARRR